MTTEKNSTTKQAIWVSVLNREAGDLLSDDGLFQELKRGLLEKALGAVLTHHLVYEKTDPTERGLGNSRKGHSSKRLKNEDGVL